MFYSEAETNFHICFNTHKLSVPCRDYSMSVSIPVSRETHNCNKNEWSHILNFNIVVKKVKITPVYEQESSLKPAFLHFKRSVQFSSEV